MKNLIFLGLILLLCLYCAPKKEKIEKIIENGVEVVLNHIEPYKIKNQQTTFTLEEDFIIDTERAELAELGITSMRIFDVDLEGNIYIYSESRILHFNKDGNYVNTIGQKGQGPGEMGLCSSLNTLNSGEISTYDLMNKKFLIFNKDGSLKEEIKDTSKVSVMEARYLDNGNYLCKEKVINPNTKSISHHLALFDKDFMKINDLDGNIIKENPLQAPRFNLFDYYILYQIFNYRIYVANSQKENLEIEIYDLKGDLVKKIRKVPRKTRIPDYYKQAQIEIIGKGRMWDMVKDKAYFPENFPALRSFYIDDEGKILLETYQEGNTPEEILIEIFTSDGIYVGNKSIKKYSVATCKNNRFYCITEIESGFEKLVVYKMQWK